MARGGVNKAVVQAARLALIARGENPSIDAVRIEMGNTGSKTTIHRYLRELGDSHTDEQALPASIDDELTGLVAQLSKRLREQAQQQLDEGLATLEAEKARVREALELANRQLSELTDRYALQSKALETQTATLLTTRDTLQAEQKDNARLTQANHDLAARVIDKDEQIRSLEEKHLHARDALEHYRNSVKDQREQEQRRHEQQVQQAQMELRQAQQHAAIRQEELTQLNRDNERLLAECRTTTQSLKDHQARLSAATAQTEALNDQFKQSQTQCALLQERLQNAQSDSESLKGRLIEREQQNRVLELILIKTEVALENLRSEKPDSITAPPTRRHSVTRNL
jgi:chromosome segregation ATPase